MHRYLPATHSHEQLRNSANAVFAVLFAVIGPPGGLLSGQQLQLLLRKRGDEHRQVAHARMHHVCARLCGLCRQQAAQGPLAASAMTPREDILHGLTITPAFGRQFRAACRLLQAPNTLLKGLPTAFSWLQLARPRCAALEVWLACGCSKHGCIEQCSAFK